MSGIAKCAAVAVVAWNAGQVTAGGIAIANPGFESPGLPNCGYQNDVATGWVEGGVWRPGEGSECHGSYPNGVPEGVQIGFTNDSPIVQTLADDVAVFTRYVLRVDVGRRTDSFTDGSYLVQLYGGATVLAEDNSSLSPPPGGFVTATVSYDALPGDPVLGSTLQIQLARVTGTQANFDHVRLDAFDIDCNNNGIVDEIDIGNGLLPDADDDGIADACDVANDVPGDITGDGMVGPADLAQLLSSWGVCPSCPADLNNDGVVGPADLSQVLANWE
jgi:hypothetical protein